MFVYVSLYAKVIIQALYTSHSRGIQSLSMLTCACCSIVTVLNLFSFRVRYRSAGSSLVIQNHKENQMEKRKPHKAKHVHNTPAASAKLTEHTFLNCYPFSRIDYQQFRRGCESKRMNFYGFEPTRSRGLTENP